MDYLIDPNTNIVKSLLEWRTEWQEQLNMYSMRERRQFAQFENWAEGLIYVKWDSDSQDWLLEGSAGK